MLDLHSELGRVDKKCPRVGTECSKYLVLFPTTVAAREEA